MDPQTLHDLWLVITVISTLAISGLAVFLWCTFKRSSRRWFFWTIGMVLASIAIEHVCAELKNLYQPPPASSGIAVMWVIGRAQEAIVAVIVLGYMVFGRNGAATNKPVDNPPPSM